VVIGNHHYRSTRRTSAQQGPWARNRKTPFDPIKPVPPMKAQCQSFLHDPAAELAVKEHYVLLDGLTADVQAVGGEVRG
jgi:hypothetical protein